MFWEFFHILDFFLFRYSHFVHSPTDAYISPISSRIYSTWIYYAMSREITSYIHKEASSSAASVSAPSTSHTNLRLRRLQRSRSALVIACHLVWHDIPVEPTGFAHKATPHSAQPVHTLLRFRCTDRHRGHSATRRSGRPPVLDEVSEDEAEHILASRRTRCLPEAVSLSGVTGIESAYAGSLKGLNAKSSSANRLTHAAWLFLSFLWMVRQSIQVLDSTISNSPKNSFTVYFCALKVKHKPYPLPRSWSFRSTPWKYLFAIEAAVGA